MRILHLCAYYKPAWKLGGPVQSVSLLCEGLIELGAHVEVITTDAAGGSERLKVPIMEPCQVDGVTVTYLKTLGYWRYFFTPGLVPLLRKRLKEFDVVHVAGFFTFWQVASAISIWNTEIPFVLSPRGSFMPGAIRSSRLKHLKKNLYTRLIESPIVGRSAGIHCTSRAEEIGTREYFPQTPTFVVPNGLRFSDFNELPPRGRLRRYLGIDDAAYVFLYLARLHPLKGLELSMRALSKISDGSEIHLLIAGQTETGSDVRWRNLANDLGVAHRCHFVGMVTGTEKLQCLRDADAFVRTSYYENFGNSIVEALFAGIPVLVSDQAGLADWVTEKNSGLVVPLDSSRIASAMATMCENRKVFARLAGEARDQARKDFDYKQVSARMLRQYKSVISTGRHIS